MHAVAPLDSTAAALRAIMRSFEAAPGAVIASVRPSVRSTDRRPAAGRKPRVQNRKS